MFRVEAHAAPYVDSCVGWKNVIRTCSNHPQQDREGGYRAGGEQRLYLDGFNPSFFIFLNSCCRFKFSIKNLV